MLIFTLIGLGLASPFLLLSASSQARLRAATARSVDGKLQAGHVLPAVRHRLGFMLWVLTGMIEGLPMLFAHPQPGAHRLGCWIYGRWALPHKSARTQNIARLLTLLAIAAGLWFGMPPASASTQSFHRDRKSKRPRRPALGNLVAGEGRRPACREAAGVHRLHRLLVLDLPG
jgi:hypothetical protein